MTEWFPAGHSGLPPRHPWSPSPHAPAGRSSPDAPAQDLPSPIDELSPPVLRLYSDSAVEFCQQLEDAVAGDGVPTVLIEESRGLSRDYVRRLLDQHPSIYVSAKAFFELADNFAEPRPVPWVLPRAAALFILALGLSMLVVGTLLAAR